MPPTQSPGTPDSSLATDPKVAEALAALVTEARLASRWAGLSQASDMAHKRILTSFLECGDPPGIEPFQTDVLDDLSRRDLVHVRDGKIALAYPFATDRTDFFVSVAGVRIQTVCAIDALGVAAMAGRPAQVTCLCPVCRSPTHVSLSEDGLTIKSASKPDARVWTGIQEVGACAADSQCKSMLLFCSPAHLDDWKHNQPADPRGFDLSLQQGAQLGAAIFGPFLQRHIREATS